MLSKIRGFFRALICGRSHDSTSRTRDEEKNPVPDYESQLATNSKETSELHQRLSNALKELDEERRKLELSNVEVVQLRSVQTSPSEVVSLQRQNDQLLREKRGMQKTIDDISLLNKQLSKESAVLDRYMSLHDKKAEAQIIEAISGLNYEIGNIASDLADALAENTLLNLAARFRAQSSYSKILSDRAMTALDTIDHKEDPTLLNIIIQAILVDFCRRVILQWRIGDDVLQASLDAAFEALSREGMHFWPYGVFIWWQFFFRNTFNIRKLEIIDASIYQQDV
jgi:hypothetical protein